MARDQNVYAPLHHLIDFPRRQIDGGNAMGIGDDKFLAVGRVGVLVEIERGGAGLARKTNYAMPGVGIDPLRGQRRLCGQHPQGGERQKEKSAHHSVNLVLQTLHWRPLAAASYPLTV